MDVFAEMIQCLNERVDKPNFHFYHVPFRNEMYNPNGVQLTADAELPVLKAYYKEHYIRKILEETALKPLLLNPPGYQMQHHFVCKPHEVIG